MTGTPTTPPVLTVRTSFWGGSRGELPAWLNTVWQQSSGTEDEEQAIGSAREFWKGVSELKR